MKALIQRVTQASVVINGQCHSAIQRGLLLLLGVDRNDTPAVADKLLERVLDYRIFSDEQDKMNLSLREIQGDLLIVSQFTLSADTRKGRRPGFSTAASPAQGEALYEHFIAQAKQRHPSVETGSFGANMQVSLTNDGPVTFLLEIHAPE